MENKEMEDKLKELKKNEELKVVEKKRHANIMGSFISGTVAATGIAMLAFGPLLPVAITVGAITLAALGSTVKCTISALKNQEKAKDIQRHIVEYTTDIDEAETMQDEARNELKKEAKYDVLRVAAAITTVSVPVIANLVNSQAVVEGINKSHGAEFIAPAIAAICFAGSCSEIINGSNHQEIIKIKKYSGNYIRARH